MLSTKRLPLLLLAIAVLSTFGFDIFEFIHTYQQATDGAPWSLFFTSLVESTVDIAVLIAVYWLMKSNVQRLEELSESKSEILSIVSHDLRSPISMMMGFAQILNEAQPSIEQRRMIRRILANGEQSLDLINNLLSHCALDENGIKIKTRTVPIQSAVNEAIEAHRLSAEQKNIRLNLEKTDDFSAQVDPQKFRQMLDNLISNAIKYSPPGSGVSVSCDRLEGSFEVKVHDEGPGLTAMETEEVFNRFSPVKHKPTGGEYSTGLGLSIARRMAELHGGALVAKSPGRSQGSTFHLQLPIN